MNFESLERTPENFRKVPSVADSIAGKNPPTHEEKAFLLDYYHWSEKFEHTIRVPEQLLSLFSKFSRKYELYGEDETYFLDKSVEHLLGDDWHFDPSPVLELEKMEFPDWIDRKNKYTQVRNCWSALLPELPKKEMHWSFAELGYAGFVLVENKW